MEFYRDKKVLITGSSGLLGSHLLDLLVGSGQQIRVLTRKPIARHEKGITVLHGDIRDSVVVDKIVEDTDVIFHLAAIVNVDKSIINPFETLNTNVIGTVRMLESARRQANKPHIIFSSSISVYGIPQMEIITENHPFAPSNPYSASKAAADIICQTYIKTYNLPITILRPSTLYGPRQRITQLIPRVILQGLLGKALKLGSLNAYRDFCYVNDAAIAFALAGANPEAVGQIFNISTGRSMKIADVIERISKLLGKKLEIRTKKDHYRPHEITVPFMIDSANAKRVLRWLPHYNIDLGLKETIEWFRSQKEILEL
jgi:nucleoside-diphosphate-sugar epimerase